MILRSGNKGYTIIEILMVVALIGILAVAGTDLISDTINESRFDETVAKVEAIKSAIIGDPKLMESGARSSFGYLGDIGAIPDDAQGIDALIRNPGHPDYAIDPDARIGVGWNGPYLTSGNNSTDFTTDAWGNALVYKSGESPPYVKSYGADGADGGTGHDQDIIAYLSTEMLTATVNGFVCNAAGPFDDAAEVVLNYPDGAGALRAELFRLRVGDKGKFQFASVPLGVRSISVYVPSQASPTSTIGPVMLTIDKPNFFVPCNKLDLNP